MQRVSARQSGSVVLAAGPGSEWARIFPVVLSGGTGTRLWPLSRQSHPKQLLALNGPRTMLQETTLRLERETLDRLIVIGSSDHRFALAEQLRASGIASPRIVLEPVGRNTAPAAAVAAMMAAEDDGNAIVLLMPADHLIADSAGFRRAIASGAGAAADGHIVLFGTQPKSPATGYGYVETASPLAGHEGVRTVARFTKSPMPPPPNTIWRAAGTGGIQEYSWWPPRRC